MLQAYFGRNNCSRSALWQTVRLSDTSALLSCLTSRLHPVLLLFLVVACMQTHIAEVLAAMIPCSRLYGYLGCTLAAAAAATGAGRHAYSEWLDTYSGAEYLVRTAQPLSSCAQLLTHVGTSLELNLLTGSQLASCVPSQACYISTECSNTGFAAGLSATADEQ